MLAVVMFGDTVSAHPGHGNPEHSQGFIHVLTSTYHVSQLAMAGLLVVALASWQLTRHLRNRAAQSQSIETDRRR